MIDDSVKTLVTAVAGIGVIVGRLSDDVNAVVSKLSTTALHPLDAEDKAAIDAATQDLQTVAAKLAALDHALTPPPEPTGPTGV